MFCKDCKHCAKGCFENYPQYWECDATGTRNVSYVTGERTVVGRIPCQYKNHDGRCLDYAETPKAQKVTSWWKRLCREV